MSLVTTKDLMLDAQKNHYAIGAFNAENMEMVQAIIAAAEELRAPVIVQTSPGTLKYASPAMFHAMVAAAASEASVPVVMHLDHGSSYELAMQAFRAGYTSVADSTRMGQEIAERLVSAGVNGVILTST